MMIFMTDVIKLDPERVAKKREEMFGSQTNLVKAWRKRFGKAPHQTHISKVEQGVKGLSVENVGQLAELLETNVDWLMHRSDDDKPVSDLEDQVVFSVRTEEDKKLLNTIGREFLTLNNEDKLLVLDLVARLSNGKPPRLIE